MGQNQIYTNSTKNQIKMCRNYFDFQYVIGKGGFGKVWRVVFKKNQKLYALKEMSKVKIIDKKSEKSIKGEREILSQFHHPFIINMVYAFQDYENLYLVMDLLTGGDLRYHISKLRRFTEVQSKFFIACLILGLEYIHSKEIIHRDIKPENLVCENIGYIRITDFGVSKKNMPDNSSETSGTPGYMAPEVLTSQNHSYPVDFYAIGVMCYEFMMGQRPYLGKSRKEIRQAVLAKQEKIEDKDIIKGWSKDSADFINKCLQRKAEKRLGYTNGITELKNHPWFKGFNWTALSKKTMSSPFVPKAYGNYDKKYCEKIDKLSPETMERYQNYMKKENFVSIFENYTFFNIQTMAEFDSNPKKNDNDSMRLTKHTCTKGSTSPATNSITNKDEDKNVVKNKEKVNEYLSLMDTNKEKGNNNEKSISNKMKLTKFSQPKKIMHNASFIKNRWDSNDFSRNLLNLTNNRMIMNSNNSNFNNLNSNDGESISVDLDKLKMKGVTTLKKNEEKSPYKLLNANDGGFHLPLLRPSGSTQDILGGFNNNNGFKLKIRDKFNSSKKSPNGYMKNKMIGLNSKFNHRHIFLKKSESIGDFKMFLKKNEFQ